VNIFRSHLYIITEQLKKDKTMNERSAITLCIKHSDPCGYEYLVSKYCREAVFYARGLLGNEADSADACQEAFAKAFAAIKRIPVLDNFYPWFYRILRNTCLNMLSRRSTAAKYIYNKTLSKEKTINVETPVFLLEKDEERVKVWNALNALKTVYKEILIMKYIQGLQYSDISKNLSIPRGTVMSRLYNARKAFKECYLKQDIKNSISGKEV